MGRSKSEPTQKRANDDPQHISQHHVPILGRRALLSTERQHLSSVIDAFFSDDSDSDSYHGPLPSTDSGRDNVVMHSETDRVDPRVGDEDDVPDEGDNTGVSYARMNFQERNRRKRRRPSDLQNTPSTPSRNALASIVQRIEQEESVKQQNKRMKKQKVQKSLQNDTLPTSKIFFAPDAVVIPPPEIQIVHNDSVPDESIDSKSIATDPADDYSIQSIDAFATAKVSANVRFMGIYSSPEEIESGARLREEDMEVAGWLCDFPLPSSFLLHFTVASTQLESWSLVPLPIVSKQGAIDVWTFVSKHVLDGDATFKDNSDRQIGLQALGRAVEAGSVRLEFYIDADIVRNGMKNLSSNLVEASSTTVRLRIGLTQRALHLCRNEQIGRTSKLGARSNSLPSALSNRKTKKHGQRRTIKSPSIASNSSRVSDIYVSLALVFPSSEIADIWGPSKDQSQFVGQAITAKHIYSLVDNVQLQKSLLQISATSIIPITGLVPTLRPYQSKAVEWMLHREKRRDFQSYKSCSDDEWELAWLILCSSSRLTQIENVGNTGVAVPSPSSLSMWKRSNPTYDGSMLLFCPYTGWLVNSFQQAKELTIGASSSAMKGGILAESMGLGKTVEVLACILAHPFVDSSTRPITSSSGARSSGVKRKLLFSDDYSQSIMPDGPLSLKIPPEIVEGFPTQGCVDDLNDFCVVDDESETDEMHSSPVNSEPLESSGVSESTVSVAVVTPIKESNSEPTEERWIENDVLGACICGNLIGFHSESIKSLGSIVVCDTCEEPMHMNCAAFGSLDEMKSKTFSRCYRHVESDSSLQCLVCDKDHCPCCASKIESGATLIITPPAILTQWEREIHRHTRSVVTGLPLRVVIYDGIKRLSQLNAMPKVSSSVKYMHARHLSDADIVLMTFDALMNDLGHSDDNQFVSRGTDEASGCNLRRRKKYRVVPSPLLSIKWWRVCLDEAQRVETPTALSAQMALKLDAVHRWCISGTPIQRGNLHDLYGLLLFLRLDPFCEKKWFQKCFNPFYRNIDERIKHLLHNVLWRSTKHFDLVKEQMGIPDQVERKVLLKFSSIEKHFYNRQLEQTILAVGDVQDGPSRSSKKNSTRVHIVTDQLHKLRAACCHPQVGSSGIGAVKRRRHGVEQDSSVSSRVMSMSQILDKFIDDAKLQCEESQRLAVLHTNGMAATSYLKTEAKQRGINIPQSNRELLERSCGLYFQSLQLADENGVPTLMWGEVLLSGSVGFRCSEKIFENYSFSLGWQRFGHELEKKSIWTKLDVTLGPARKITQLKARACRVIPEDVIKDSSDHVKWLQAFPKDCIFQCMSASGEFVDVEAFSLPHPGGSEVEWTIVNGFRTNKSKAWRLVVESFHPFHDGADARIREWTTTGTYLGVEFECYEATIASDPLQRLHCLHNASHVGSVLLQLRENCSVKDRESDIDSIVNISRDRVNAMNREASKIESLYLNSARALHRSCQRRLEESSAVRNNIEQDLMRMTRRTKPRHDVVDCWDDFWWDDFLVICHMYGNEAQHRMVHDKLIQDLDGMLQERTESSSRTDIVPFPMFNDVAGLRTALQMRIQVIRDGLGSKSSRRSQMSQSLEFGNFGKNDDSSHIYTPREGRFKCAPDGHRKCMNTILNLNELPCDDEIRENSRCHVCKADWLQTGPKCRHCKIGDELEDLTPDKVTIQVLTSLHALLRGNLGATLTQSSGSETLLVDRAKLFFELLEACRKEKSVAYRLWRSHLSLLNDMDELNQCKSTMRLTIEGEDVTALSKEQQNAVISPIDINACFHDHAAKQAMALGALSRAKGTLQYLKNLSVAERQREGDADVSNVESQTCVVCLSTFDTDRAVLRCGHSFHLSPCLEKLRARSGGTNISCPLRCRLQTSVDDVMIASEGKRHDDGSHNKRRIKGSYGTKVSRLVGDILDMRDLGEKGLVFSQWDAMLDICEHALRDNEVTLVRVSSIRQIGACTRRFRDPDCSVMLINVKNGGEGLTLVEATHVFMVEPLLNCGLDSQAINRTHRIGQNRKTYVWRYIMEDTVEVKIDKMRVEHQGDEIEDALLDGKKSMIKAGGIDGGFQSQEEVLDMLQP
jgi:SNF2 family DNA or RNA helicase